jgi:hypothetical protein
MSFADDIKEAADDLFALAGEVASYTSATDSFPVTAIFRGLTPDDMVSPHVMADAVICQIRESDFIVGGFGDLPVRGDKIERGEDLTLQSLEVVDRFRDESGVWKLTCQQNIRVTP